MSVIIRINESSNASADYVTMAPSRCDIEVSDGTARTVDLQNQNSTGGQLVFKENPGDPISDTLRLSLPSSGRRTFYVAGRFDSRTRRSMASTQDKDTIISAIDQATGTEIGSKALMVRVRKDGNSLEPGERDRFLSAMVRLNRSGQFTDYLNMHTGLTDPEIHGRRSFLPWHRHYLLDLERRLQQIDPSVSLPYWRFDRAAPNLFTRDFMGVAIRNGRLDFNNTNPLVNWSMNLFGRRNA